MTDIHGPGPGHHPIELSDEERRQLLVLLDRSLGDLAVEVRRTDAREFRQGVVHEKEVLETVRGKVQES